MPVTHSFKTQIKTIAELPLMLLFIANCGRETEGVNDNSRNLSNNTASFIYNMIPENPNASISPEYARAINTFSVNLLNKVYSDTDFSEKNVVLSPFSVGRNLAVITEGSTGESRQQLLAALGGEVALNDAKNALSELLYADKSVVLQCADGLWIDSTQYSLKESFKTLINSKYGVEVAGLDFSDVVGTVNAVNNWVSTNTHNTINTILSLDDMSNETAMLIANAIYFEADWTSPFDITKTLKSSFNSPTGTVDVDMMTSKYQHKTYKTPEFENVKLYYGTSGKDFFYLDIYMPTTISIDAFIENKCLSALGITDSTGYGALKMPKFFFNTKVDLVPILQELGIKNIFNPLKSEITEMLEDSTTLYVEKVVHEAGIKTDEEGTKAFAATVSIAGATSADLPSPDVVLDSPFIYFIRAGKNGLALFAGVVNNPDER